MVNSEEATMKSTARWRILVLVGLALGALVSSSWALWRTCDLEGLALNLGTELIGALATYALLELFIGGRERREAKKADLIAQMGSQVQDVAVAAAEELRRHGWLSDGSLQGADLFRANLRAADLIGADLSRAVLVETNLQWTSLTGAKLIATNLSGARLGGANLHGADLNKAKLIEVQLHGAVLLGANLCGARLWDADLREANLREVDLKGASLHRANLQGADFDENTTLPDGTKWTLDTDMARFTDPKHPDFWRPDAQ
jgi:uncharacterized protein YjbI with pentapeptide repeats